MKKNGKNGIIRKSRFRERTPISGTPPEFITQKGEQIRSHYEKKKLFLRVRRDPGFCRYHLSSILYDASGH